MAKNIITHEFNQVTIDQRISDGFLNGTAMCAANDKQINSWFQNKDTLDLFQTLSEDLGIETNTGILQDLDTKRLSATKYGEAFPGLITIKRGSPENGGGVWIHPDLSMQLAQWCNKRFALQVSRWIKEWLTTGKNPIVNQEDKDRLSYRSTLKDDARTSMTDEIKRYLQDIQRYDDQHYRGKYFAKVHDRINIAITGETAKQMRERLELVIGREVKESELIRDYFPPTPLQRYIAVCQTTANIMIKDRLKPLDALDKAIGYVLSANHVATPIDFAEHIGLTARRIKGLLAG